MIAFFSFILLGLSFLSVWVRRDPKIWMSLLCASLVLAWMTGLVQLVALLIIAGWGYLWFIYRELKGLNRWIIFGLIILVSFLFKFWIIPGFHTIALTAKYRIGFAGPLVGIFAWALFVPVARKRRDWKEAGRGVIYGCIGIGLMALLAVASGATHWQMQIPSAAGWIYLTNLVLVAIPEEAFYRGFLQNEFFRIFNNKLLAVIVTSAIFTFVHIYWSPNLAILGFVFIASLLYGWVYLVSSRIESAILTHFLLNFIHITFFSYHAA